MQETSTYTIFPISCVHDVLNSHSFIFKTYLKMTSKVLAAAILQGRVLVLFIRSNNKGMNLVCMVMGLMQLARQENFSKQSA